MGDFDKLAADLRRKIGEYYEAQGKSLDGPAGRNTLDTNSSLTPRRGEPLVEMLRSRAGIEDLGGFDLIDIGCGFGALSVYFANLGATVRGIDQNASRLAVAAAVCREHGLRAEFGAASMQRLPFDDQSADIALMNNSLCYVLPPEERHQALLEAHRVLRPGGNVLIRNPNRWSLIDPFTSLPLITVLPGQLPGKIARRLGRDRSSVRLMSVPAAKREVLRAHFRSVKDVPVPNKVRPRPLRLISRYQHLMATKAI